MKSYTCDHCGGTFTSNWADCEAIKEYQSSDYFVEGEPVSIICDDCYKPFKQFVDGMTPEDHERIRNAAHNTRRTDQILAAEVPE